MQKLFSLGLLAALGFGGLSVYNGTSPAGILKMVSSVGGGLVNQVQSNAGAQQNTTSAPQQVNYAPQGGQPQYSQQNAVQFSGSSPLSTAPTIKIASFNIRIFGDSKARKQDVMKVLGEVVRQFDVIAIQEIRTQDNHFIQKFLRQYVNTNGKTLYDARVSPRLGRTSSTEQYAFLFNTATINVHPQVEFVMDDPTDALHREPHVAMFQAKQAPPNRAFTFVLMNTHTDPDEVPKELAGLAGAFQAIQRMPISGQTEDDIILLGDLNTAVPATGPRTSRRTGRSLQPKDLHAVGRLPNIYPLIKNQATNMVGSKLHDNLLISKLTTTEFTGNAGVYDIPSIFKLSKDNALQISDHLPVWGEFSIYESPQLGRLASAR